MSDLISHVSDDQFEAQVLQSNEPVLVDFWAEWCGPCKAIAPILDELATEFDGKLKIAKVNVDDNGELAAKYGAEAPEPTADPDAAYSDWNGELTPTRLDWPLS